jgi:hypothetical protein
MQVGEKNDALNSTKWTKKIFGKYESYIYVRIFVVGYHIRKKKIGIITFILSKMFYFVFSFFLGYFEIREG